MAIDWDTDKYYHPTEEPDQNNLVPTDNSFGGKVSSALSAAGDWINAVKHDWRANDNAMDEDDIRQKIANGEYADDTERKKLMQQWNQLEYQRLGNRGFENSETQTLRDYNTLPTDLMARGVQLGGTLQGFATQAKGAAVGAGIGGALGFLTPAPGGAAAGAKIGAEVGNAVGGTLSGWNDNRSNAIDAAQKVSDDMEKKGMNPFDPDNASIIQQTYERALNTGLPLVALDMAASIYGGSKILGAAGEGFAKKLGKTALADSLKSGEERYAASTLGKYLNKFEEADIPEILAAKAAKASGSAGVGKVVNTLATGAIGTLGENFQELGQNRAADEAVNNAKRFYAPGEYENPDNFTWGNYDWTSPENIETMKDVTVTSLPLSLLTGGLAAKGNLRNHYLQSTDVIKFGKQAQAMFDKGAQNGGLDLNQDAFDNMKQAAAVAYNLSEEDLNKMSVDDVARMNATLESERYGGGKKGMQLAMNDTITRLAGQSTMQPNRTYLTNASDKFFSENGYTVDPSIFKRINEGETAQAIQTEEKNNTAEQEQQTPNTPVEENTAAPVEGTPNVPQGETTKPHNFPSLKGTNWEKVEGESPLKDTVAYHNSKTGQTLNVKFTNDPHGIYEIWDNDKKTNTTYTYKNNDDLKSVMKKFSDKLYSEQGIADDAQERAVKNGIVDKERGLIGTPGGKLIHTVKDFINYQKQFQGTDKGFSQGQFLEIVRALERAGMTNKAGKLSLNVDIANPMNKIDTTTGEVGGRVYGNTWFDGDTNHFTQAVVSLYKGADLATAVHELAHVGWTNLSEQQKGEYANYAVRTEDKFICECLGLDYNQETIDKIHNIKENPVLKKEVDSRGILSQTIGMVQNGATQAVVMKAVQERFAHEMSAWYINAERVGAEPKTVVQNILSQACRSLGDSLKLLEFTDKYIKGEGEFEGIRKNMDKATGRNINPQDYYERARANGQKQVSTQQQQQQETQAEQQPSGINNLETPESTPAEESDFAYEPNLYSQVNDGKREKPANVRINKPTQQTVKRNIQAPSEKESLNTQKVYNIVEVLKNASKDKLEKILKDKKFQTDPNYKMAAQLYREEMSKQNTLRVDTSVGDLQQELRNKSQELLNVLTGVQQQKVAGEQQGRQNLTSVLDQIREQKKQEAIANTPHDTSVADLAKRKADIAEKHTAAPKSNKTKEKKTTTKEKTTPTKEAAKPVEQPTRKLIPLKGKFEQDLNKRSDKGFADICQQYLKDLNVKGTNAAFIKKFNSVQKVAYNRGLINSYVPVEVVTKQAQEKPVQKQEPSKPIAKQEPKAEKPVAQQDKFDSDIRDLSDQEFKRVYEDALDWETTKTVTERQKKQYKDIMAEAINRGLPTMYETLDEARATKAKNVNEVAEAPKEEVKKEEAPKSEEKVEKPKRGRKKKPMPVAAVEATNEVVQKAEEKKSEQPVNNTPVNDPEVQRVLGNLRKMTDKARARYLNTKVFTKPEGQKALEIYNAEKNGKVVEPIKQEAKATPTVQEPAKIETPAKPAKKKQEKITDPEGLAEAEKDDAMTGKFYQRLIDGYNEGGVAEAHSVAMERNEISMMKTAVKIWNKNHPNDQIDMTKKIQYRQTTAQEDKWIKASSINTKINTIDDDRVIESAEDKDRKENAKAEKEEAPQKTTAKSKPKLKRPKKVYSRTYNDEEYTVWQNTDGEYEVYLPDYDPETGSPEFDGIDNIAEAKEQVQGLINDAKDNEAEQVKEDIAEAVRDLKKLSPKTLKSELEEYVYGVEDAEGSEKKVMRGILKEFPKEVRAIKRSNSFDQWAGEKSEEPNKQQLSIAKEMENKGKSSKEIYYTTGWRRGFDNKWRYYIPDNWDNINFDSIFINGDSTDNIQTSVKLGDIYDNERLYKAYPWLKDVSIVFKKMGSRKILGGSTYENKTIYINTDGVQLNQNQNSSAWINPDYEKMGRAVLLHEIQHQIQGHEGFARGAEGANTQYAMAKAINSSVLSIANSLTNNKNIMGTGTKNLWNVINSIQGALEYKIFVPQYAKQNGISEREAMQRIQQAYEEYGDSGILYRRDKEHNHEWMAIKPVVKKAYSPTLKNIIAGYNLFNATHGTPMFLNSRGQGVLEQAAKMYAPIFEYANNNTVRSQYENALGEREANNTAELAFATKRARMVNNIIETNVDNINGLDKSINKEELEKKLLHYSHLTKLLMDDINNVKEDVSSEKITKEYAAVIAAHKDIMDGIYDKESEAAVEDIISSTDMYGIGGHTFNMVFPWVIDNDQDSSYAITNESNEVSGISSIDKDTNKRKVTTVPNKNQNNNNSFNQSAGEHSLTADIKALNVAKRLENQNSDEIEILRQTGWFRGEDGKWRYFIPDYLDNVHMDIYKPGGKNFFKLSELYDNPELYAAYPWLKDTDVYFNNLGKDTYGETNDDGEITINSKIADDTKRALSRASTLIHEVQHAIQMKEGFAEGINETLASAAISERLFSPDNKLTDIVVKGIGRGILGKLVKASKKNRYDYINDMVLTEWLRQKCVERELRLHPTYDTEHINSAARAYLIDAADKLAKKYVTDKKADKELANLYRCYTTVQQSLRDYDSVISKNAEVKSAIDNFVNKHGSLLYLNYVDKSGYRQYKATLGEREARNAEENAADLQDVQANKKNFEQTLKSIKETNSGISEQEIKNDITKLYKANIEYKKTFGGKVDRTIDRYVKLRNELVNKYDSLGLAKISEAIKYIDKNGVTSNNVLFQTEFTEDERNGIAANDIKTLYRTGEQYIKNRSNISPFGHSLTTTIDHNGKLTSIEDYNEFTKETKITTYDTSGEGSAVAAKNKTSYNSEQGTDEGEVNNKEFKFGNVDKDKSTKSVTFTSKALKYKSNQDKAQHFRNLGQYWKESPGKDGSITFTRKDPKDYHTENIVYSGINEKDIQKEMDNSPHGIKERVENYLIKKLANDKAILARVAKDNNVWKAYKKMMVLKDQAQAATAAIQHGLKDANGKQTKGLTEIINAIGLDKQWDFIDYCEAHRILALLDHKKWVKENGEYVLKDDPIIQKMSKKDAEDIINSVKHSTDYDLFESNRTAFVDYNNALLYSLVKGGFITMDGYNFMLENDKEFIPLNKKFDIDEMVGAIYTKQIKQFININCPLHNIKSSTREIENPFITMQERTMDYFQRNARNQAGLTFIQEIANAKTIDNEGHHVKLYGALCQELNEKAAEKMIGTKGAEESMVFSVMENGKKRYFQVADRQVYLALKAFTPKQISGLAKIMTLPKKLTTITATLVPDFGLRNLVRDNFEAFISTEHGFLPFIDAAWGWYQIWNNTDWWQEYQSLNGEYDTLNREDGSSVVYTKQQKLMKQVFHTFTDRSLSNTKRMKALWTMMKLTKDWGMSPLKKFNDYMELGTRVGEYRNARLGYTGYGDRLSDVGLWGGSNKEEDLNRRGEQAQDMYSAAYDAKEITLNFGQHGELGEQLNQVIPFFNASLQGAYKTLRIFKEMGTNEHGQAAALWAKMSLVAIAAILCAGSGDGDPEYDQVPDWEKNNFWVLPKGIRIPKDQVFGKIVGNTVEIAANTILKHQDMPLYKIFKNIVDSFSPDNYIPELFVLLAGTYGNYDFFRQKDVVQPYMEGKMGYEQKDVNTSNVALDMSKFLYRITDGKADFSAKKIDFALQQLFSNTNKYVQSILDLGTGRTNEKMGRGGELGFLRDSVPAPLNNITGTFVTNRTTYKSISDFYDEYSRLAKIYGDKHAEHIIPVNPEEQKKWKRYEKAYQKDQKLRKTLREIREDKSLSSTQKREQAEPIFQKQLKLVNYAEGVEQ